MVHTITLPRKHTNMKLKIAWKILFIIGLVTVFLGLHFIFIRPTFVFFPEDSRFTQLSAEQLQTYNSNLFNWIGLVFRSWGAFVISTGVFVMGTAAFGLRKKEKWAFITLALAGIPSFSIFFLVNVALKSDFVVVIGLLLILYLLALILAFEDVFGKNGEGRKKR